MSIFSQRCKLCGRRDKFDFTVPDDVWNAVVPVQFGQAIICLPCFDSLASMRGIDYAGDLSPEIHFVGEKASFVLRIVTREEAPTC